MINEYLPILKKSPLFKDIKDEDIVHLLQCQSPKIRDYGKNECIVLSGETIDCFGLILSGEASILKENSEGNRMILSVVGEGELFGEMLAYSSRKMWPVTVRVQNSCKVMFLENSRLLKRCSKMCTWHDEILQNFLGIISDKALMLNKKVEYLSIKSIRGKIAAYLLDQYQNSQGVNLSLPLKRNELADFLNVSRPSLSREISSMKDEGILDYHLSTFRIKDIEALQRYCEY